MKKNFILAHDKSIRIVTTIFLTLIIFGDMWICTQLFSNNKMLRYIDLLGILSAFVLTVMFVLLFLDSWKTIKVNEKFIEKKILFYSNSTSWDDVIQVKNSKTNQFRHFVQGRIIILITKKGKKIEIAEKYKNFNLFYNEFIESRLFVQSTSTKSSS